MATVPPSQLRLNYHPDCEAAINSQICMEIYTSYTYLSMGYYFGRDDVALKHFSQFFLQLSRRKEEHAERLIRLQDLRGGRILLRDIKKPDRDEWENGFKAVEHALHLENCVTQRLLDLHQLATSKSDPYLCDFLENHHLLDQLRSMKELEGYLINLCKIRLQENGMGEYLLNQLTLGDGNKN